MQRLPFCAFSVFLATAASLLLLGCAVTAQTYPACHLGDAACAPDSKFEAKDGRADDVWYCCPSDGVVSLDSSARCTGGVPAGCATNGHAQATFEPCIKTSQSCPSGSQCVSGTSQWYDESLGILAIGHSPCPSGSSLRVNSMRITTTGMFEYGGGFVLGPLGMRAMVSGSASNCYSLTRPYIAVNTPDWPNTPSWSIRCANNQPCSYSITSSVTCVATPTTTQCSVGPVSPRMPGFMNPFRPCASNTKAITANDGNQYCCDSASDRPTFGASGSCTCGQLHIHQLARLE